MAYYDPRSVVAMHARSRTLWPATHHETEPLSVIWIAHQAKKGVLQHVKRAHGQLYLPQHSLLLSSGPIIMEAVWEKFSSNIKKQAVKTDGIWSVEDPQFSEWAKLLQFKVKKRIVDSTRSAQAWNQWLAANKGTTVTLMVYEYGMAIGTAKDRDDFMKAPAAPPPSYITNFLDPAESRFEEHLNGVAQSSSVALDCLRASIGDCQQLRRYLESAGRYLDDQEQRLVAREAIFEGIICNLVPPSPSTIIDPMPLIENIEDAEHAEIKVALNIPSTVLKYLAEIVSSELAKCLDNKRHKITPTRFEVVSLNERFT
ncbi:uncharacterized protein PITG_02488 [Phytophthora infestans T30-4]|uniref:Uncharacterized protein n=1 Tax=Phytophthora infestans (strain T30-4) TaxID=403677 RepID=D0MWG3_PHYIT|nr:uncharacterized protein PITG_02488 [Phytophthora infestans T30-4]EEY63976.1 conserved hypothetical protein [Phytophthora infestans T30-4]|eukprot:XP_002907412.1 conserved hypothetical protein [Phytophthora infestans T30-4]